MTSTVAVVYDPDAFAWVQGPTGTAQYRDVPHMADGYIAFDYNKEKLLQSGKGKKINGSSDLGKKPPYFYNILSFFPCY